MRETLEHFLRFKSLVNRWASVRGIYEQSNERKQKAKALEEIGEYLTAENDHELMDAIGDIAVCIVNAAEFNNIFDSDFNLKWHSPMNIDSCAKSIINGAYRGAIKSLYYLCTVHNIRFEDCLDLAWNEIKDRRGMMIDGFYVKWENLTDDQKTELEKRMKAEDL